MISDIAKRAVKIIENTVTPEQYKRMIKLVESRGVFDEQEKNKNAQISALAKEDGGKYPPSREYNFEMMDQELFKIFHDAIEEYVKEFKGLNIQKDLGYSLLKHDKDEEFDYYHDPGSPAISAVLFLNDDYAGGEIEFEHMDIKIKPQKGDIVLFPSNFLFSYRLKPIISGEKYSVITWFIE